MDKLKKLFLVAAFLQAVIPLVGQTHIYPAQDTNNTFTGQNTFNNYVTFNHVWSFGSSTVSNQAIASLFAGLGCTSGQAFVPFSNICSTIGISGVPAGPAFAVNFANSGATALQGDSTFVFSPSSHLLNVQSLTGSANTEINVMAAPYNAKCDGFTDDTAAFQAALAALPATGGSVLIPNQSCKITAQLDIGSTSTSAQENFRTLRGLGSSSTVICAPTSTINSCVRVLNGSNAELQNFTLSANSNATYGIDLTASSGHSNENDFLENLLVTGAGVGIGIGPDTTFDLSHVTLISVKVSTSSVAGFQIGNGTQANVLDNNCYNCTVDLSANGVLIEGGGFSMYGGGFDSNTGTDIVVTTPPDQGIVISGVRSETSPAFWSETGANATALGSVLLNNVSWFAGAGATTYAVTHTVASSLSITDSKFTSAYNTVQFNVGQLSAHPTPFYMNNVGTSNATWASLLATMVGQANLNLYSVGDYYINPSTFVQSPGSGLVWSSSSPVFGGSTFNVTSAGAMTAASDVSSQTSINSPAGTLGTNSNLLTYSQFDSGNPSWSIAYCNTPNPPILTPNTTDVTDPQGGHTALKFVSQSTPATGCGGSISAIFQNYALSTSTSYAESLFVRGAVGGETGVLYIGVPGVAGAFVASVPITLTTSWQVLPVNGSLTATYGGSPFGFVFLANSTSASYYLWGGQLKQTSAPPPTNLALALGAYVHTVATNSPASVGLHATQISANNLSFSTSSICPNGNGGLFVTTNCTALPIGSAGGALSGTYPNPGFATLAGCPSSAAQYPCLVANYDQTGQTAIVPSHTLYTVPANAAGFYRLTCHIVTTMAATSSSTLPNCGFTYTDADAGVGNPSGTITFTATSTNNQVGTSQLNSISANYGNVTFNAKASTTINVATLGYLSSGATPMAYAVRFALEYLGAQ